MKLRPCKRCLSIMIWSHWSKEIKIHRTIRLQAFLSLQRANITQCSNHLPQRAEILTQRSNLTPQQAKNIANDLTRFRHKAGEVDFTPSSLSSRDQQIAVGSLLRIKVFLLKTSKNCCWMHWVKNDLREEGLDLGTWLHSRIGKNYSHNRTAKHIKISCLPRDSSLK